ncbi:MAG: hypothetical protein Q7R69_00700 [bacterium]|nr:hypothetical protein [bacterium]
MQKYEKKFINELGNAIDVQVSAKDIEGIKGVSIFISGPTSNTENNVTLAEAKVIHEQLGLLIEKMGGN